MHYSTLMESNFVMAQSRVYQVKNSNDFFFFSRENLQALKKVLKAENNLNL